MNSSERSPAPYDLHLHSYWSYDATAEDEAHFKRARELGVPVCSFSTLPKQASFRKLVGGPEARRDPDGGVHRPL